jgi:hypothetical protein
MTELMTENTDRSVKPRRRRNANDNWAAGTVAPTSSKIELAQYRSRWWANLGPMAFSLAIVIILCIGWSGRDDNGLTPESGVGYWLGIAGSAMMLLLLLYPLRKRMPSLRAIGTVAFWFRAHMILGACGCVLILWHANFKFGSINSNVALTAMLVVTGSGIVGRYLYSKIHRGLYGSKAVVADMLADAAAIEKLIGADGALAEQHVVAQLNAFARFGMSAPKGILVGLVLLPVIGWRGSVVRMRLVADARRDIKREGQRLGWSRKIRRRQLTVAADLVTLHIAAVKKAAAFAFYERLFGIWHVFHMPLFVLLVVAVIVHVFAAHFF